MVTLRLVVGEVEDAEALVTVAAEEDLAVAVVAEVALEIVVAGVVVEEALEVDGAAQPTAEVSVISLARRRPFKAMGVSTTASEPHSRLVVSLPSPLALSSQPLSTSRRILLTVTVA
jgi:hypothetical protein